MASVDLRRPERVEPVEVPARLSQTLLRHFNRCSRSGYLYMKYGGGMPSHDMNRGTAFHVFAERATNLLLEQGEAKLPFDVGRDLMAEVLRDVKVPVEQHDRLRQMAYHWCEGFVVAPAERVIAVEDKIVVEIAGRPVSMKIDYAELSEDGSLCAVRDYKTSFQLPAVGEVAGDVGDGRLAPKSFQLLLYAVGLAYGRPVRKVACTTCEASGAVVIAQHQAGDQTGEDLGDCPDCGGRGAIEEAGLFPLAGSAQHFDIAEVYPAYLHDEGIPERGGIVLRQELAEHVASFEAVVTQFDEAVSLWDFGAIEGTHCQECPASAECPLPARLKSFRGRINTEEELCEAARLHFIQKDRLAADWREIRTAAGVMGTPVPLGADEELAFVLEQKRSVDRDGMLAAAQRAADYGEPYDPEDFMKVSESTPLRRRKVA
jgi:hypothetical protein